MSHEDFYTCYYEGKGIEKTLLIELLEHIAFQLSVPAGMLRPQDRFSVELAPIKGEEWDSGYGILLYEIQQMAKKKNVSIQKKVETVDDCIRLLAHLY